jgi:hypothetical protein
MWLSHVGDEAINRTDAGPNGAFRAMTTAQDDRVLPVD